LKLPKSIKSFVRAAGLGRPAGSPPPGGVLFSDRAMLGTKCVFDVGANKGQFGRTLRGFGYAGTIVSFEPLSTAHARLLEAARSDPLWRVHDRCAIGRTAGETSINISANSVSSSILPTTPELEQAEPRTGYVGIEHVAVVPLSDVFEQYASPKGGN
jgi:FkbM family methyltransferase